MLLGNIRWTWWRLISFLSLPRFLVRSFSERRKESWKWFKCSLLQKRFSLFFFPFSANLKLKWFCNSISLHLKMKKRRKKAIKLVLNIYHFMLEEWRDLAHSHTSSVSNADCLDLFSLFWDARVWKFFSWRFYEQLQGLNGFECLVWNNIVEVCFYKSCWFSDQWSIDFSSDTKKFSPFSPLTIDPENLFSRKTDYLAEEFSFQFLLFQWKISIQKSLLRAILKDFPVFWTLECKLFFLFPFTPCMVAVLPAVYSIFAAFSSWKSLNWKMKRNLERSWCWDDWIKNCYLT